MSVRQVISAFVALQVIATTVAQSPATLSTEIGVQNVTTKTEDYINENRRQYNATLQSYLDQINGVKNSLEDQLKVIDKQKVLLLNTIQQTYERIDPLEVLSLPSKYCVQQYRAELPYGDIIKANIESCITSARSYSNSIVSTPNTYYSQLNSYYNSNLKTGLNNCAKSHSNPSLNYTLCVTTVIAQANTYTNTNRVNFASSMQSSDCSLNSRIDVAVSCSYNYVNSALTSIGAATRLIDECINGYLENKPKCEINNTTVYAGCPNVVYMEVKDGDFQNKTIANPIQGLSRSQDCLELRFV
ncbi:uncharacterized protein LOC129252882 [Anastrepha obliqua]|uniref:uncharacterized protein LOC129252882 n=1 Tax=Anastrepha obliqua TaxID=95512 RepID=UPI002409AF76|nr:uncharacterized protein LOC129252882 [Anastrepha obliqua]